MTAGAIDISEVGNASEWHEFFARADRKFMTQTWAFGEAKRATGWLPQRLVLSSGNEVLAICQVLQRFFGGVLVASRINLGPMMLKGTDNRSAEVHRALRRRWSFLRRGVLLVAPALEHTVHSQNLLSRAGFSCAVLTDGARPCWTSPKGSNGCVVRWSPSGVIN